MIRATDSSRAAAGKTSERESLRRRVRKMSEWFNGERFDKCFTLVDPGLRNQGKVDPEKYRQSLTAFKSAYGAIRPWYVRISLHLDASSNKHDHRPFAFVYIVWQDEANDFHMFRERWVKESGHWFTRVAGLMTYDEPKPAKRSR